MSIWGSRPAPARSGSRAFLLADARPRQLQPEPPHRPHHHAHAHPPPAAAKAAIRAVPVHRRRERVAGERRRERRRGGRRARGAERLDDHVAHARIVQPPAASKQKQNEQ